MSSASLFLFFCWFKLQIVLFFLSLY